MLSKLAWRNIWRNRRRSLITMASIAFAVFFAVVMRSMQLGTYANMIGNVVESTTGYLQVNAKGYHDEPSLDRVFPASDSLLESLAGQKNVKSVFPRVSGFALAAGPHTSRGVAVSGIDMKAERATMGLDKKITKGHVPDQDGGAIVGSDLAAYFGIGVGDTLVMIGQGHYGATAAGKFQVAAIAKFPTPEMDGSAVLLPLDRTRVFFSMQGLATEVLIDVHDPDALTKTQQSITAALGGKYEVHTWKELMPELTQSIQADNAGGLIMIFVLYLVVAFGIFGTILMMTEERQYEFGVSVAIGMRRAKLAWTLVMEIALLALLGAGMGVALSYPLSLYFHAHPIALTGGLQDTLESYGWEPVLAASDHLAIPLANAGLIWIIAVLLAAYPMQNVLRLKPMNAMRN